MSEASDYGSAQASAMEFMDGGEEPKRHWWDRWTQLTSKRIPDETRATLKERELLRRSRLLSWILLGMFAVEILLLALDSRDPATLLSVVIALVGTVGATFLNRLGYVTAAGVLLVVLVLAAVLGGVTNAPGHVLDTVYLPAYDLFAIAVIIAASVLPRVAAFIVAALSIALICADYFLQSKGADLLHQEQVNGALSMIARPIVLQVIVATVAFLWVRGAEEAIRRADRAEELAALEHAFAEQRRQLEIGVQQILETHVRVANGDFAARAPMNHDNLLWQIAASLNNLLSRLQKAGQADHQLRRTEEEVRRLASAIDDARLGRRPIWPAPTGTVADLIIERIVGANRPTPPRGLPSTDQPRAPFDGSVSTTTSTSTPAQSPASCATGPQRTPRGTFPTMPPQGYQHGPRTFGPPRMQPTAESADSALPWTPTQLDARPSGGATPANVDGLPPLAQSAPQPLEPLASRDSAADLFENWPNLFTDTGMQTPPQAAAAPQAEEQPTLPNLFPAESRELPAES